MPITSKITVTRLPWLRNKIIHHKILKEMHHLFANFSQKRGLFLALFIVKIKRVALFHKLNEVKRRF